VTLTVLTKATTSLLGMACDAAERLGAAGVLILPEGPMDWAAIRATCPEGRLLVAVPSPRLVEAISDAGLIALEVEAGASAIPERITLALIEAVANDHLTSGARVIVVYSGFEAETLDSLTVVRLGEHLERLTSRDLRALETSVP